MSGDASWWFFLRLLSHNFISISAQPHLSPMLPFSWYCYFTVIFVCSGPHMVSNYSSLDLRRAGYRPASSGNRRVIPASVRHQRCPTENNYPGHFSYPFLWCGYTLVNKSLTFDLCFWRRYSSAIGLYSQHVCWQFLSSTLIRISSFSSLGSYHSARTFLFLLWTGKYSFKLH